ncbi:hypothetical protein BJF89_16380 [Corynebacterium sp. CNJ-954]|nr:hypothetical protein BJF89_16380 [Corynebacterium sp. CNJ-954]
MGHRRQLLRRERLPSINIEFNATNQCHERVDFRRAFVGHLFPGSKEDSQTGTCSLIVTRDAQFGVFKRQACRSDSSSV